MILMSCAKPTKGKTNRIQKRVSFSLILFRDISLVLRASMSLVDSQWTIEKRELIISYDGMLLETLSFLLRSS